VVVVVVVVVVVLLLSRDGDSRDVERLEMERKVGV